MEMIDVVYFTDPVCPWSWAAEPALRRVEAEFGDQVRIRYVMVGMAREVDAEHELRELLEAVGQSGMPADPRVWIDGPPRSSHPACLAVKAAAEQRLDGPYLRRLRLGLMTRRERLDNPEALLAAARDVAGLDVARFDIDMRSNAIVEAFGADRDLAGRRPGIPAFAIDGGPPLEGPDVEGLRAAVLAAGGDPQHLPDVETALRRLGEAGAAEVAAACGLPGPRARMELWRLAAEWRVRARPLVCGELWEPTG
jgi:predicted DsbA family dithiol-disulfide isomerase